jgi:hypothetical protein
VANPFVSGQSIREWHSEMHRWSLMMLTQQMYEKCEPYIYMFKEHHAKGERFTGDRLSSDILGAAFEKLQNEMCQGSEGFSDEPVCIEYHGEIPEPLTLIDLPGFAIGKPKEESQKVRRPSCTDTTPATTPYDRPRGRFAAVLVGASYSLSSLHADRGSRDGVPSLVPPPAPPSQQIKDIAKSFISVSKSRVP